MKLGDYLRDRGLNYEAFASLVGSSPWAIGKWARGERTPRPRQMASIREATNGAVTADDFLPPRPEPTPTAPEAAA